MGHVPHVFVPAPWEADALVVPEPERHHLERVLRRAAGSAVTYTDGAGRTGAGTLEAGRIGRGEEHRTAQPPDVTIVVGLLNGADRMRLIVEKLGELGVRRLVWLRSEYGRGRSPAPAKVRAWAIGALQQSRGSYLLDVAGPVDWAELPHGLVLADKGGADPDDALGRPDGCTIVIGPEGGFSDREVPAGTVRIDFGPRILRTETAAIVAASAALRAQRRSAKA